MSKNEYFWSCLDAKQASLKMTITPALQLMIISSDQCIEELIGNINVILFIIVIHMYTEYFSSKECSLYTILNLPTTLIFSENFIFVVKVICHKKNILQS